MNSECVEGEVHAEGSCILQASAYGQIIVSAGYGGVIKVFENVGTATALK